MNTKLDGNIQFDIITCASNITKGRKCVFECQTAQRYRKKMSSRITINKTSDRTTDILVDAETGAKYTPTEAILSNLCINKLEFQNAPSNGKSEIKINCTISHPWQTRIRKT
jgi:hypothetical protein